MSDEVRDTVRPVPRPSMVLSYGQMKVTMGAPLPPAASIALPAVAPPADTAPASDLHAIADLFADGRLEEALAAVTRLLAVDPADARAWLLQAELLERADRTADALEGVKRAIALWPDVTPAYRLQLRLAQSSGDAPLAIDALHRLLLAEPLDPMLNSEMGARLSQLGDYERAIPFLRIAAPALLHENCSIWNYTTALVVTGHHQELIDAQPLLDRMAGEDNAAAYPPFTHLAASKLSVGLDRAAVIGTIEVLQASDRWLSTDRLYDRVMQAIESRTPFSLIRLDHARARLVSYCSIRVHMLLRAAELSAVANSVWPDWFGEPIEAAGVHTVGSIARSVSTAIDNADVIGLPDADVLRHDQTNLGFLAETQRLVLDRAGRICTTFQYATQLHQQMPFLRPLLQELPFLGVVGPFPELARRLGHFCGIAETRVILVGVEVVPKGPDAPTPGRLAQAERALAELEVPFPGAVFLVALNSIHGVLFCDRIKTLGGIALDVSAVAPVWAGC